MNPQRAEFWFGKGRVLQRFWKQDSALNGYHKALELKPEDEDI